MTSYTEASLVHKLSKLVDTQDSITVLSQWLMYHRKHAASSVQTWARELHKATPARKLSFVYLANDVVQSSRRKGEEFVKEFAKVFPETLPHAFRHTPAETQQKIGRILSILEERRIYSTDYVQAIKAKLVNRPGSGAQAASPLTGEAASIAQHLETIRKLDAAKSKSETLLNIPSSDTPSETLVHLRQYQETLKQAVAQRAELINELSALSERMQLFSKGDGLELEKCQARINQLEAEAGESPDPAGSNLSASPHSEPSITPPYASIDATQKGSGQEEYSPTLPQGPVSPSPFMSNSHTPPLATPAQPQQHSNEDILAALSGALGTPGASPEEVMRTLLAAANSGVPMVSSAPQDGNDGELARTLEALKKGEFDASTLPTPSE
ncbi:Regulation of nuclear pre-mRNA domain containing protein 1B [Thoreauomyces humboldtii]|nr:Regulation of nuclear pre-mRNA domain containing protein 1B [Thoreauomyces humboldtii]